MPDLDFPANPFSECLEPDRLVPVGFGFQKTYLCSFRGLLRLQAIIFLLGAVISALFIKDFGSSFDQDGFESTRIASSVISSICFLLNLTQFIAYVFNIIGLRTCSSKKAFIEIMFFIFDILMSFLMAGVSVACWARVFQFDTKSTEAQSSYSLGAFTASACFTSLALIVLLASVFIRLHGCIKTKQSTPNQAT